MRSYFLATTFLATAIFTTHARAQVPAFLIDSDLDQLFSVDITTGAATLIAGTLNNGLATPADLAWRADTQELWTIDLAGGEVGTIDVTNGTFTPVFQSGLSGWQGMAWDPVTAKFYLSNQSGSMYVLDPATGLTTLLGPDGAPSLIVALDADSNGNLWAMGLSAHMLKVDKTTGAATQLFLSVSGVQGFGIDETTGLWYGANTNDDGLYTMDPANGASTFVGFHGAGINFAKGFDLAESGCDMEYGAGCPGSGGFVPEVDIQPACMVTAGAPVTLQISQALGGSTALMLLGLNQVSVPIGSGCSLHVSPILPAVISVPLAGVGPGMGGNTLFGPIPPSATGFSFTVQFFVVDPGSPLGFSSTPGYAIDIQ